MTAVPKCQRCVWGVINFVIIKELCYLITWWGINFVIMNFVTYKFCDVKTL